LLRENTVSINGSNAQASSSASCDESDTGIGGNYVVTSFVENPAGTSFIQVREGIVAILWLMRLV